MRLSFSMLYLLLDAKNVASKIPMCKISKIYESH